MLRQLIKICGKLPSGVHELLPPPLDTAKCARCSMVALRKEDEQRNRNRQSRVIMTFIHCPCCYCPVIGSNATNQRCKQAAEAQKSGTSRMHGYARRPPCEYYASEPKVGTEARLIFNKLVEEWGVYMNGSVAQHQQHCHSTE